MGRSADSGAEDLLEAEPETSIDPPDHMVDPPSPGRRRVRPQSMNSPIGLTHRTHASNNPWVRGSSSSRPRTRVGGSTLHPTCHLVKSSSPVSAFSERKVPDRAQQAVEVEDHPTFGSSSSGCVLDFGQVVVRYRAGQGSQQVVSTGDAVAALGVEQRPQVAHSHREAADPGRIGGRAFVVHLRGELADSLQERLNLPSVLQASRNLLPEPVARRLDRSVLLSRRRRRRLPRTRGRAEHDVEQVGADSQQLGDIVVGQCEEVSLAVVDRNLVGVLLAERELGGFSDTAAEPAIQLLLGRSGHRGTVRPVVSVARPRSATTSLAGRRRARDPISQQTDAGEATCRIQSSKRRSSTEARRSVIASSTGPQSATSFSSRRRRNSVLVSAKFCRSAGRPLARHAPQHPLVSAVRGGRAGSEIDDLDVSSPF